MSRKSVINHTFHDADFAYSKVIGMLVKLAEQEEAIILRLSDAISSGDSDAVLGIAKEIIALRKQSSTELV